MSGQEAKTLIRRVYEEGFSQGNLAVIDELFAPDFQMRTPTPAGGQDREAVKQGIVMVRGAFPDVRYTVEDVIADGDRVVARWTARGTHQAAFLGVPPTGKKVTFMGVTISRQAGGQAVEGWLLMDQLGLMQQLGAVPAAAPAAW